TLARGYAIVRRTSDARIVRAPAEAPPGTGLAVRLARGELTATVDRAPDHDAEAPELVADPPAPDAVATSSGVTRRPSPRPSPRPSARP
ncbi:MAG: hypothetical protein ACXWNG_06005, partial [Candidatus Limnocylindrales bacterium]